MQHLSLRCSVTLLRLHFSSCLAVRSRILRVGGARAKTTIGLAVLFGGAFATVPNVLYWCRIDAPVLLFWIYILLVATVIAALVTRLQMTQGPQIGPRYCDDVDVILFFVPDKRS